MTDEELAILFVYGDLIDGSATADPKIGLVSGVFAIALRARSDILWDGNIPFISSL